jgi:hypothetical protein
MSDQWLADDENGADHGHSYRNNAEHHRHPWQRPPALATTYQSGYEFCCIT